METESRFNLSRSLEAWRAEFSRQPGLGPEDISELQTHLLEHYEAARRQGLAEYVAFKTAREMLGPADQLGAEFAKAHPLRLWAARVFLMAVAGLLASTWEEAGNLVGYAFTSVAPDPRTGWAFTAILWWVALPLVLLAGLARGRLSGGLRLLQWSCAHRWRLFAVVVLFTFALEFANLCVLWLHPRPELVFGPGGRESLSLAQVYWGNLLNSVHWPGPLLALAVWLLPRGRAALNAPRPELLRWSLLGCLALSVYRTLGAVVLIRVPDWIFWLLPDWLPSSKYVYLGWLSGLVLIMVAVLIVRGALNRVEFWFSAYTLTRARICAGGSMLVIAVYGTWFMANIRPVYSPGSQVLMLLSQALWPSLAVALIAWSMPPRHGAAANSEL